MGRRGRVRSMCFWFVSAEQREGTSVSVVVIRVSPWESSFSKSHCRASPLPQVSRPFILCHHSSAVAYLTYPIINIAKHLLRCNHQMCHLPNSDLKVHLCEFEQSLENLRRACGSI